MSSKKGKVKQSLFESNSWSPADEKKK